MAQKRRESPVIRIGLVWCALGVNVHVHFPLPFQLKLFRLFMKHLVSSKVGAQREVEASWLIHGFPKEFQANEKLACRKQNVHSLSLLQQTNSLSLAPFFGNRRFCHIYNFVDWNATARLVGAASTLIAFMAAGSLRFRW